MNKLLLISGIIALIAVIPMASQNIAQAGCRAKAYCYAPDDTGPNPLDIDGPYDPCDNYINYSLDFYRTDETGSSNAIKFSITGSMWIKYVYSYQYEQGWHNESGNYYVGPSGNHSLRIDRYGISTGYFTNIEAAIEYVADNPTK